MKWLKHIVAALLCCVALQVNAVTVMGDVNGDGTTDIDDVNIILNVMLHKFPDTPASDIDGSGITDIDDLNRLINVMLHKVEDNEDQLFELCYNRLKDPDPMVGLGGYSFAWLRAMWSVNELTTDEAVCSWFDSGVPELNNDSWTNNNPLTATLWNYLCSSINTCNSYLNSAVRHDARHDAEVRWLRAWYYYGFLDAFGDIPLTTTGSPATAMQVTRSEAFNFVVNELLAIEPLLAEPREAGYGRADRAAAWMLLSLLYLNAEVYAGQPQWNKAEEYARKVINSPYKLCTTPVGNYLPYQLLFMADNDTNGAQQEMVMSIPYDGLGDSESTTFFAYQGSTFLVASTFDGNMLYDYPNGLSQQCWAGIRARKAFVDLFFPKGNAVSGTPSVVRRIAKDNRALFYSAGHTAEVDNPSDFRSGFGYVKFINLRSDGAQPHSATFADIDYPLLRVAEAYLTLAEVDARQHGGQCTSQGVECLNAVRSRAAAAALTTASLSDVLDEWGREFAFEGRRRTDLVRFGQFGGDNTRLWEWKGGVRNGRDFSPLRNVFGINDWALSQNSNLTQNPGYDPSQAVVTPATVVMSTPAALVDLKAGGSLHIGWSEQTITNSVMQPVYRVEVSLDGTHYEALAETAENGCDVDCAELNNLLNEKLADWDMDVPAQATVHIRLILVPFDRQVGEASMTVKPYYVLNVNNMYVGKGDLMSSAKSMVRVGDYSGTINLWWRMVYIGQEGIQLYMNDVDDRHVLNASAVNKSGEMANKVVANGNKFTATQPGWFLMTIYAPSNTSVSQFEVQFLEPQVWLMGPVTPEGMWNELEEGTQFSVPTTADGEFVSPPFARDVALEVYDGGVRAYVKIPGHEWWQSEFMVFDGWIFYRGDGWDQQRVAGNEGQRIYLNFDNDSGRIE